jgi:hypothetical protein
VRLSESILVCSGLCKFGGFRCQTKCYLLTWVVRSQLDGGFLLDKTEPRQKCCRSRMRHTGVEVEAEAEALKYSTYGGDKVRRRGHWLRTGIIAAKDGW